VQSVSTSLSNQPHGTLFPANNYPVMKIPFQWQALFQLAFVIELSLVSLQILIAYLPEPCDDPTQS